MKVNMAEGPSTTITPSNQFVVKCSVCSHHVYKHIRSPFIGELFETFCEEDNKHEKYAVAVHLNNCLTMLDTSWGNMHLPLLHQEAKDHSAAQQLVEV